MVLGAQQCRHLSNCSQPVRRIVDGTSIVLSNRPLRKLLPPTLVSHRKRQPIPTSPLGLRALVYLVAPNASLTPGPSFVCGTHFPPSRPHQIMTPPPSCLLPPRFFPPHLSSTATTRASPVSLVVTASTLQSAFHQVLYSFS